MDATEYAQGLRDFADWIEQNQELVPRVTGTATVNFCCLERDEFIALARALDGTRVDNGAYFSIERAFGGITACVFTEKKNVGEPVKRVRAITEWEVHPDVQAALDVDRDPGDCHREPSEEQLTRTGPYLADSRDENAWGL